MWVVYTCSVSMAIHIMRQKASGRNDDVNSLISQELSHRIPEKIRSQAKQLIEPKVACILSGAQGPEDTRPLSQR